MSALTGALVGAGALVLEEVLVTSSGGTTAVTGIFGEITKVVEKISNPAIAAIPDRTKKG